MSQAEDLPPGGQVVAVIPTSPTPRDVIAAFGSVWVANGPSATVDRIDPATDAIVASVPTGRPVGVLAAGAGSLWAASPPTDTIVRIDPATNQVIAAFPSGGLLPEGLRVQDGFLWVANHHGNPTGKVTKIDLDSYQVLATIPVGALSFTSGPQYMAATPGSIWVGVPNLESVVRIDTASASVAAIIPDKGSCGGLTADGDTLYVAGGGGPLCQPGMTLVDLASNALEDHIVAGGVVGDVALGAGSLWASAANSGFLDRIDLASGEVVGMLKLGGTPMKLAFGFGSIWVADVDAGTLLRVEPL